MCWMEGGVRVSVVCAAHVSIVPAALELSNVLGCLWSFSHAGTGRQLYVQEFVWSETTN